jgi:hypothetical protein
LLIPANTAPVLAAITDQTIGVGVTMNITNNATDNDLPAQTLTFSLVDRAHQRCHQREQRRAHLATAGYAGGFNESVHGDRGGQWNAGPEFHSKFCGNCCSVGKTAVFGYSCKRQQFYDANQRRNRARLSNSDFN